MSAPELLALQQQLSQLLQALDSDDPVRIEKEIAALEPQLPAGAVAAILASVQDYDFRGAENQTRQLATDYAIDLEVKS